MQSTKTIIALHDDSIRYLTLAKDKEGFYVKNYDFALLEDGIIKNGEILKADFLSQILKKIAQKIKIKKVDVLIPHEYFLFDLHHIEKKKGKNYEKLIKKYLKENKHDISWVSRHAFEYDFYNQEKIISVLFRTLPYDFYKSYEYVFKKSGMMISSFYSEALSFNFFFPQENIVNQVFIKHHSSYVLEYRKGIYHSYKKFHFSYRQLVDYIKKELSLSQNEAENILTEYGVLDSHREKKVLKKIERSLIPLFDFLRKRKMKEHIPLYVHFESVPLKGFIGRIKKIIATDIFDFSVLESQKKYFHEILSLSKKESYSYETLIARAMQLMVRKEK